jgi:chromosomal replication initiation ATPase DnaA
METIVKRIQSVDAKVLEINQRIKELDDESRRLRSKVSKILKRNNYKIKSSNEVIIQSAHSMVNDVVNALPEISKEKLLSSCRDREIVLTRQCIGYILHNKYGLSLTSIGNILDRNHATIIHGNKAVEVSLYLHRNHKDSRSKEVLNYLNEIGLVMGLTEKINTHE